MNNPDVDVVLWDLQYLRISKKLLLDACNMKQLSSNLNLPNGFKLSAFDNEQNIQEKNWFLINVTLLLMFYWYTVTKSLSLFFYNKKKNRDYYLDNPSKLIKSTNDMYFFRIYISLKSKLYLQILTLNWL